MSKPFRTDINAIRAVAVALVVLFHAGVPGFGAGFLGVDLFFVVSGFLMTQIVITRLDQGTFSLAGFYWARCVRIVPALLALLVALFLFGCIWLDPLDLTVLGKHALSAELFLSNLVFWREAGYFDAASKTKWLLHTWSLSVEWQFYLVYPLVLLGVRKLWRSPAAFGWALALMAGASLASAIVATQVLHMGKLSSFAFFMLPARAWEMIAGGSVFLWSRGGRRVSPRWALPLAAGLLLCSMCVLTERDPWPSAWTLLPVVAAALALASSASWTWLDAAPVRLLGLTSYSVYLWHWPIVVGAAYFGFNGPVATGLIVLISCLAGWLSHRYVEQFSQSVLKARAGLVPRASAVAVVCAALFAGALLDHGFVGRVRGDVPAYLDAVAATSDRTYPVDRCGGVRFGVPRVCLANEGGGPPTVAVIGDSFAEMWWGRAVDQARARNLSVAFYTSGGCPPISEVRRAHYGTDCPAVHRARLAAVLASPKVRTVVLAGMWTSYFQPSWADVQVVAPDGRLIPVGTDAGFQLAQARLKSDVDALVRAGKSVVIWTTAPYPGVDVPQRVRQAAFRGQPLPDLSFDFDDKVATAQPIDRAILAMRAESVSVVDLRAFFCPAGRCSAVADARVRYADSAHLRDSFLRGLPASPLDVSLN